MEPSCVLRLVPMMKRNVCIFLSAMAAFGQSPDKLSQVDRIFAEFNNHTPGCAVAVEKNGVVVLKAGYGMADLERNVPITPDTVFESGSLAKQFTATALMLAAQKGKLSLDDPLRKFLPELPDYGTPVTIRHVLSHVSGLREWRSIATYRGLPEGRIVYTNQDLLEMASMQRALNFEPGTHYSYTNTGYNIATILLERALANGQSFVQFTQENIFAPLAMVHTCWRDDYRTIVPNRALAYRRLKSAYIQDTPVENIIGAGGLLTTVGDLLLWNENFTRAKIGGPELVKAQQTPAILKDGRRITYAAGLNVADREGIREVSHSGSTGGYATWLARYPEQGVSAVVLCNSSSANPGKLGWETARSWLDLKPGQSGEPLFKEDPARLSSLAGLYRNTLDSIATEVTWHEGKLHAFGGELTPVAAGAFRLGREAKVTVEAGPPIRLLVDTPNGESVIERVEPVHPSDSGIQSLTGRYFSADTGSTVVMSAGSRAGDLAMRIGPATILELRPTYRDAFATTTGTVRFMRDAAGAVTGFSASDPRTWDLRFDRVR